MRIQSSGVSPRWEAQHHVRVRMQESRASTYHNRCDARQQQQQPQRQAEAYYSRYMCSSTQPKGGCGARKLSVVPTTRFWPNSISDKRTNRLLLLFLPSKLQVYPATLFTQCAILLPYSNSTWSLLYCCCIHYLSGIVQMSKNCLYYLCPPTAASGDVFNNIQQDVHSMYTLHDYCNNVHTSYLIWMPRKTHDSTQLWIGKAKPNTSIKPKPTMPSPQPWRDNSNYKIGSQKKKKEKKKRSRVLVFFSHHKPLLRADRVEVVVDQAFL